MRKDVSEKSKSKIHPFAGHLLPSEEVLWMSSDLSQSPQQIRRARAVLLLVVSLIGIIMTHFSQGRPFNIQTLALLLNNTGCMVSVLAILILTVFWLLSQKWPTGEAIAVTNKRILHRSYNKVIAMPLEDVKAPQMYVGRDGSGSIFFPGALYLGWSNVENVTRVKAIIDEAQKRHLNDPNA